MRDALGLAAVTATIALAGMGVLLAIGVVERSARQALAALGLAYLAGIAAVTLTGTALLTLGITFRLPVFGATCAAFAALGAWQARRQPAGTPPVKRGTTPVPVGARMRWVVLTLAALAGAYLVLWLLTAVSTPFHVWDSWSLWGRKGIILATSEGLPTEFFTSDAYTFMHPEYPLLLPILESVYFRAMGDVDTAPAHAIFWLMLVAFAGALAYLGSSDGRSRTWMAVVLAVVFAPLVYGQLSVAYADVPMGFFLCLGVLLLARWSASGDRGELVLATLLLAGAASTKNEGLAGAVAAFAAAPLLLTPPRGAALGRLALALGGFVTAIAPWRIWTLANGIEGKEIPLGKGFQPAYLADRLDRLLPTLEALGKQTAKQGGWLVPAAALVVTVALAAGIARRLALYYAITAAAVFGAVVWTFLVTRNTLQFQIETSANRVVVGAIFVAVAALLHLGGVLERRFAGRRTAAPAGGRS